MPSTEWVYRFIIIVPLASLTAANAAAKIWDPDTGGDKTFGSVELSPTGRRPATHTACNTAATSNMRTRIQSIALTPGVRVYDAASWTWRQAADDAGLALLQA